MEYLLQFYAIYGSVINFIGINALLALSLNVTLSAGMLSLGNAAFAGLGGYAAGILSLHYKLPFAVSLAGGACAAGIVALDHRVARAPVTGSFSGHGDPGFR